MSHCQYVFLQKRFFPANFSIFYNFLAMIHKFMTLKDIYWDIVCPNIEIYLYSIYANEGYCPDFCGKCSKI